MKTFHFLICLLATIGLFSCSQDEVFIEGTPNKGLMAEIPSYQFENSTRVAISNDLQTFKWSTGDQIGVYASDANVDAFAGFKIKQGGSSTGSFENNLFKLDVANTYYAFYPFSSSATVTSATVTYTGQKQTANNSASHLGAFNYMCGNVEVGSNGNASVQFQNIGAVMQVKLTVDKAGTYKTLKVTSDNAKFITKGTASMKTGAIKSTATSASVSITLGTGFALSAGDELIANILVAPVNMSGSNLTLTLVDSNGGERTADVSGKDMKAGKAYLYQAALEIPYVTFTCTKIQTLTMTKAVDGMEYSVGNGEWETLGTAIVGFGSAEGNLRLRSKNINGTSTSIFDYSNISFGTAAKVECSGDIRTLIDYENYSNVDTSNAKFYRLFCSCDVLTSAPELPATSLSTDCYARMFRGCTSLIKAPKLPATVLAPSCYYEMFYSCTSLSEAPSLPANNLESDCYYNMFGGCTSLITAPNLPATSLAEWCYSSMFADCSSLTTPPELPATTLTKNCYGSMFNGCSSLTTAPKLPATTLADGCYGGMFANCISLICAPELPAMSLAELCYSHMFQFCTSLETAPVLPATTLVDGCYYNMFDGCIKLNSITMMATDISASQCLDGWTNGVSSTGTFVMNKNATWNVRGESGIPEGWTIVKQ